MIMFVSVLVLCDRDGVVVSSGRFDVEGRGEGSLVGDALPITKKSL